MKRELINDRDTAKTITIAEIMIYWPKFTQMPLFWLMIYLTISYNSRNDFEWSV